MKPEEKLAKFCERPDPDRVIRAAEENFLYEIPHPVPAFDVQCRRCKATGDEPDGDMQLSRHQYKKNPQKQFTTWVDMMFKCCQCSCVEAFGEIPFPEEEYLSYLEMFEHPYQVEWRETFSHNKQILQNIHNASS